MDDVLDGTDIVAWQFPDLDLCDWLYDKVKTIHEEGNTTEGVVAGGFDPEQKKSNEVLTDIQEVNPQNKCWPTELDGPTAYIFQWLQSCLLEYKKMNPMIIHSPWSWEGGGCQFQYYEPGQGFFTQHFERAAPTIHGGLLREAVWMMYLNDIDETDDDGDPIGGTHFPQQKVTIPCKKGLTLFWPAGWTYPHVGSVTDKNDKLIATGWMGPVIN